MRAIEAALIVDTLIFTVRTRNEHRSMGYEAAIGSFTACSFWYIECLAPSGELGKAQLLFEKMLGYANHLGLYSEELGADGRPWKLPAGVYPLGVNQRSDISRSRTLGTRQHGLALVCLL